MANKGKKILVFFSIILQGLCVPLQENGNLDDIKHQHEEQHLYFESYDCSVPSQITQYSLQNPQNCDEIITTFNETAQKMPLSIVKKTDRKRRT